MLGYEASVFNLVYVNNEASVRWVFLLFFPGLMSLTAYRLWDRLGFSRAGCIPRAGRLKRKDGGGEEYIDAWVYYKRFY